GAVVAAEAMTRAAYRAAGPGIARLDPRVRPCTRTACVLYGGILDAIAQQDYAVLHRRAVVSRSRRAATAAAGAVQVLGARWRAGARRPVPAAAGGAAALGAEGAGR